MTSIRRPLKNIIIEAWRGSIERDYLTQRINSERSLQASFWSHLNALLPETRRIFIEPSIKIKVGRRVRQIYPDIVICNTRQVISIIELKYLPRVKPSYKKDIENLALISENRNQITLAHSRFSGVRKGRKEYSLSKTILFVWAGIHARSREEILRLYSEPYESLAGSFIQLHAETRRSGMPEIYVLE